MWCQRCGPVLGVKNTHRVRNTGAIFGELLLPGAALLGSKVESYYCPNCGATVRPAWMHRGAAPAVAEPIEPRDEAYWEAYVARVTGKPAPRHVTRVTPDGKWITFDDGDTSLAQRICLRRQRHHPSSLASRDRPAFPPIAGEPMRCFA